MESLTRVEILQSPEAVSRQNASLPELLSKVVDKLWRMPPNFVMTLARGSSANACSFLSYLLMKTQGLPTFAISPSVITLYESPLKVENSLTVCISKSGNLDDINTGLAYLKERSSKVLSFTNTSGSKIFDVSEDVFELYAGEQRSFSTKSFICSLSAMAWLVSLWEGNSAIRANLFDLPEVLSRASELNWDEVIEDIVSAENVIVVGRGLCLPIAKEISLKLSKYCGISAHGLSSTELKHEPSVIISHSTLAIVLAPSDKELTSVLSVAEELRDFGCKLILIAAENVKERTLTSAKAGDPMLEGISIIQSAYLMLESLARFKGIDPDGPPAGF